MIDGEISQCNLKCKQQTSNLTVFIYLQSVVAAEAAGGGAGEC